MATIIQFGYGAIGSKLFPEFKQLAYASKGTLSVYDPYKEEYPEKISSIIRHFDLAFICVPTETINGKTDLTEVINACDLAVKYSDIVVIKSTVPVGTTDELNKKYNTNKIIFSPEFTGNTQHVGEHEYLVLGGDRKICNEVAELYKNIKPASYKFLYYDAKTAELSKYALNCWLGLKVSFFNEIAEAANKCGVEYDDVRNIMLMDTRINPSHTFVYKNKPYYDSHCLNKDIPSFNHQFNLPLMKEVERINLWKKNK